MLPSLLLALPLAGPFFQAQEQTRGSHLEQALEAVREHSYRADLEFFASDAMGGRKTPSPELLSAALYLRARVQSLGFTPGAEDGFYHNYPLYSQRLDGANCMLVAKGSQAEVSFQFGTDYFLRMGKHALNLELDSEVVCVGQASNEELAAVDLTGKWALLLDRGRLLKKLTTRCIEAGAAGVIVTPGPSYKRNSYPDKYGKTAIAIQNQSPHSPKQRPRIKVAFPVIMLARDAATRLFQLVPEQLDENGLPPSGTQLNLQIHERRRIEEEVQTVSNVCAFWPGSDPELALETMVISAHYDHLGVKDGVIFNGADDNASGTSGLLSLADALVAYGPMKRSVLLLWVSGEERGLWGSEAWVNDPWLPMNSKAVLDINIDMIGRAAPDSLEITPTIHHPSYNQVAASAYNLSNMEGFPELVNQDKWWNNSDHKNFDEVLGLPVIFLSAGDHEDYHKSTDTADRIDAAKSVRIVRLVMRILDEIQDKDLND
jgi:hypothetical protein